MVNFFFGKFFRENLNEAISLVKISGFMEKREQNLPVNKLLKNLCLGNFLYGTCGAFFRGISPKNALKSNHPKHF